jgi:hypothetical protein
LHQSSIAPNPADVGAMTFDAGAIKKWHKVRGLRNRNTHHGIVRLLIDIFESLKAMH